ncbi:MAG TPA: extensin family protein [Caulobacteraceae bacterium]
MGFFADVWVRLWEAALVGLTLFALTTAAAPPEHLPWTPLDLNRPVGLATKAKIDALDVAGRLSPAPVAAPPGMPGAQPWVPHVDPASTEACIRTLQQAGVTVERVPDSDDGQFCVVQGAVRITGGATPISPADSPMQCPLALRYVLWDRQVLQPAAREILGSAPKSVQSYGTYSCRRIYGLRENEQRPSEHARANALDVGVVVLEDGRRIDVLSDWGPPARNSRTAQSAREGRARAEAEARATAVAAGRPPPVFPAAAPPPHASPPTPPQRFLRRIAEGGCRVFGTVLSPEYNAAHANHLHMDGSPTRLCS